MKNTARLTQALITCLVVLLLAPLPLGAHSGGDFLSGLLSGDLYRAQILTEKARRYLSRGKLNQGKILLRKSASLWGENAPVRLRALDRRYPDFPIASLDVPGFESSKRGIPLHPPVMGFVPGKPLVVYQHRGRGLVMTNLDSGTVTRFRHSPRIWSIEEFKVTNRYMAGIVDDASVGVFDRRRPESYFKTVTLQDDPEKAETGMRPRFAIHPSGEKMAVHFEKSETDGIQIRSLPDLRVNQRFDIPGIAYSMSYLPGTDVLIVGGDDNVYAVGNTGAVRTLYKSPGRTWALATSTDGRFIATGGSQRLKIFDRRGGGVVDTVKVTTHNVVDLEFVLDNRYIAFASAKGTAGLLRVRDGEIITRFPLGDRVTYFPSREMMFLGDEHIGFDLSKLGRFDP